MAADHRQNVGAEIQKLLDEYQAVGKKIAQELAAEEMRSARDRKADRKADTRAKIIVGGAILALAREVDGLADRLAPAILARVSDSRDRALLASRLGWGFSEQPTLPDFDALALQAEERSGLPSAGSDRPKARRAIYEPYAALLDALPTTGRKAPVPPRPDPQ